MKEQDFAVTQIIAIIKKLLLYVPFKGTRRMI